MVSGHPYLKFLNRVLKNIQNDLGHKINIKIFFLIEGSLLPELVKNNKKKVCEESCQKLKLFDSRVATRAKNPKSTSTVHEQYSQFFEQYIRAKTVH